MTLFGTVTGSANDLSKSFAWSRVARLSCGNYETGEIIFRARLVRRVEMIVVCSAFMHRENVLSLVRTINAALKFVPNEEILALLICWKKLF